MEIKASLEIMEKGITDMSKAFEVIKKSLNSHEKRVKTVICQIEDKFEAKLDVYNEKIRREMKKEIINIKNSFQDKFHNLEINFKKHIDSNKMNTTDIDIIDRITKVEAVSGETKTLFI